MAKVGYIFKADRYDGFEADKEWMQKYGCVQVIEELVENEALRPRWKQLVANLERGDEIVGENCSPKRRQPMYWICSGRYPKRWRYCGIRPHMS